MSIYEKIASEIDKHQEEYIQHLRNAVKIPSVSSDINHRKDVIKMIDWMAKQMIALDINCHQIENGVEKKPDGTVLKLPNVLFGSLGNDKNKKTLLIYGHLDVQPALLSDGWDTEPFDLIEKDGKLYGRGSTDDKGPVIAWLNAIKIMQELKIDIPVNLKFCFEGMEESGSVGLEEIIEAHKSTFLKDVDFVCISDSYWLGKTKPCITYGLRGIAYYFIRISSIKQDLHSGCYGGTLHEPMNDLVWMLSQLADVNGKILIDDIYKLVAPVTDEELEIYKNIDFSLEDYCNDVGVKVLTGDTKQKILMNRWRFPSLSIHGIEGAFYGPGEKTVIPCKVTGKFSIRLVPNMDTDCVGRLVEAYLNKLWKKRGSPNNFEFIRSHEAPSWISDFNHPNYQAGARALKKVFGVEPDFIRDGGSIPITLTFQNQLKCNVMLLPIGACDDMAHSQNEKINVSNFINGIKTFVAYLLELGSI